MADFLMPSLGADMESGTLLEWKVKPGDAVKKGDLVATVETVKGAIEIEVFKDGVMDRLVAKVGEVVPVGAVLAVLRVEGEPVSLSPAGERVGERGDAAVRASPAAKRRASELGIDLTTVHGTGPEGAITVGDVEGVTPLPNPLPRGGEGEKMRGAIAAAMSRSKREIPHYYLATDIDLGRALAWLEAENAKRKVADRLLPVALLLKATALAVHEVPEVNGTFTDGKFTPSSTIHLGVAINLRTGGLIAPALLDAQTLSLTDLMTRLTDLVARARATQLRSSELGTATLTVSNLGDQGVGVVFPVIHPPQVAMVGFGRITQRPWVVDGAVVPRPIVTASLAADHRVSDGHRGGRFLGALEKLLQQPERL